MKLLFKIVLSLFLGVIILMVLSGCNPASNNRPNNETETSITEEVSSSQSTETEIIIDGEGDDWVDRPLLAEDSVGDAEGNFLDITKVYAFANQNAVYLLVDFEDPTADFVQIDIEISADSQHYLLTWQPSFPHIGQYQDSLFALGSVLEGRINLQEIGSPEANIVISQIRVMAGDTPPSDTWRSVDDFTPKLQYLTWLDEFDANSVAMGPNPEQESQGSTPPETEESIFTDPLEERTGHVWTTSGLPTSYLYRSFLQIPVGMAWGPDGYLYIGDWAGHHIVKVSPDGSMEDLGLWQTVGPLQYDGPRGIAFDSAGNLYTNNHGNIFRIDSGGNVEKLPGVSGGPVGSIAISQTDELYYTDRGGGKLLKWETDGTSTVILDGIPFAENLTFGLDGTLYLTQMGEDHVLKVDVLTGEYEIFANDVCAFDPCFLSIDPEGDIWIRGIWQLHQFSPEGVEKPFVVDGETYPGGSYNWHSSAGIAVDDRGGIWVANYNSKLVYLSPDSENTADPSFTMEVISLGLEASDLAVDSMGVVYATDLNRRQVLAFSPDGTMEVVLDHGDGGRVSVAVDAQDVLYVCAFGEILKADGDGSFTHYAAVNARRMVFGADGILYAVALENDQPKAIVGITGVDQVFTLATEIDGHPLEGELHISPALDKGLYIFSESSRNLYYIDFEGNGYLVADLKSLGGGGPVVMAASPVTGDVFIVPHGPYEVSRITPEGEISKVAVGVYGDPWGMVVSQDGKILYVAESGVIDIIPIENTLP